MSPALSIRAVPAFTDNYIWTVQRGREALVVDPGDAAPVLRALQAQQIEPVAILITHHHPDHVGGIADLLAAYPGLPVYGPRREADRIAGLSLLLDDGDAIELLGLRLQVLAVPGHTLGHIAYWCEDQALLFCGDTLFSAGCGRLFEGSPQQMHDSLSRLAALPGATAVHCTHEYTLSNLLFAAAVEPGNAEIADYLAHVCRLRAEDRPSLPSCIALERAINPFLRSDNADVIAAAQAQAGGALPDTTAVFAALRRWKDGFRPPPAP